MADVLLLHSALGLRPAVHAAAERLRAAGHTVSTPDLYEGQVFSDVDGGVGHMHGLGWAELVRRVEAAVEDLPRDAVLIGMSMGAGLCNHLMSTRGGRAAVMLYAGDPPEHRWPAGVPVQVHHAVDDPWARRRCSSTPGPGTCSTTAACPTTTTRSPRSCCGPGS